MTHSVSSDMARIFSGLSMQERERLKNSTLLFTGGAGFLGYYFLSFLTTYRKELHIKKVICLDNFQSGYPAWLQSLCSDDGVELHNFNVIADDIASIPDIGHVDYVFHMASIASPHFYRQYPIETLDANVGGLRKLLDFYKDKPLKKLVFFSSSEIYGDPDAQHIPTPEAYRGYVDCQGPRACYDEAKRFGETMCYLFHQKYGMPITIIRPFNNYGPGMRLNDARVPADFANAIRLNRDIEILSDGSPTRTFCYISDAVTGYLKCLLYTGSAFETFNIGSDGPEISIRQLAEIYAKAGAELFGYTGQIRFAVSPDKNYLNNNPSRRCPDISKARRLLHYAPQIDVTVGVSRYLEYIKENMEGKLTW